jgi:hypothetical protein
MNIKDFTELLKQHCHGDWWDKVEPLKANPEWGDCEACGFHPLNEENANKLNKILNEIKALGGPSPTAVYPHCGNDIFIDWHSEDGKTNLIWMDVNNPFGSDALVRIGDNPVYFVGLSPDDA